LLASADYLDGRLPDTLADRCIVIKMHRKRPAEPCERLRELQTTDLRRCCARFVLDHHPAIAAAHPDIPADLTDRAADIWEPLFALADLAGGPWPQSARDSAVHLTSKAQDHNATAALFLDIMAAFNEGNTERIFTRDLLQFINADPDLPWSALRDGKPMTELRLAGLLRPYGVRPKLIWVNRKALRGYLRTDFDDLFPRYIPKKQALQLMKEWDDAREQSLLAGAEAPDNPIHGQG
jgi:hypothetical protein